MIVVDFKVAANGRMVLPKAIRDAMGLHGEAKVTAMVDGAGVRLMPMSERVRRAQELYRDAISDPRSTDDFLRDRKEQSARDDERLGEGGR